MALDRELFEEFCSNREALPVLRIYQALKPAITIGRAYQKTFLPPSAALQAVVSRLEICRRPTGGGMVIHGKDLIYSVIARGDSFPAFHQARTSYLVFHEAVQEALLNFGVKTRLLRCDEAKRPAGLRQKLSDCFKNPVGTDVLLEEKKIAGGGQWRRREGFLHQGSVEIPKGISFEHLKDALLKAFERKFNIRWL